MEDTKEIIEIPLDNLELAIKEAEDRIAYTKRCLELSVRLTTVNDWVLFNDVPYLEFDGAARIASFIGISWNEIEITQETKTDENGTYIIFWGKGTFWLSKFPDHKIEIMGGTSTRDKFFGRVNGELKPLQDVDLVNVKKKALVNTLNNGIKSILGLKGLTKEQLKDAGIDLTQTSNVSFKQGKQGGTSQSKAKAELANNIKCACLYLAEGDKEKAKDFYHNAPGYADFTDKKTGDKIIAKNPEQLSERHAQIVWGKIKKEFEKLNLDMEAAIMEYSEPSEEKKEY